MSLQYIVSQLFEENTNYARASQLVNQAESLKYLSTDLYRDSKRFIYELLQNADDSWEEGNEVLVSMKLFGDHLVVAHTGKPFDSRDVRGISSVNDGTKKDALGKTGFKGIGFKAVFGQSEHVTVFSEGEYFRFDASYEHTWKQQWGENRKAWEENTGRTFECPWQIIPIYTQTSDIESEIHRFLSEGPWKVATIITLKNTSSTVAAIDELVGQVNMFLFLKHITNLSFHTSVNVNILLERVNDSLTVIKLNGTEVARWLKTTRILAVPEDIRERLKKDVDIPKKLRNAVEVELSFAAKISEEGFGTLTQEEKLLYAYLPTQEHYDFPVLVNASFYTIANRESLHEGSPWNHWLFSIIAKELFAWIALLVQGDYKTFAYELLPHKLSATDQLATYYNKGFELALQSIAFILNSQGELIKNSEAILDHTFLNEKNFIGKDRIRQFQINRDQRGNIHRNPFFNPKAFRKKFKNLGLSVFKWDDVHEFLTTPILFEQYGIEEDKALITYLKILSQSDFPTEVTNSMLKRLPFLLDHTGKLAAPEALFLPVPGELYDPNETEVLFLHPDLEEWLNSQTEIRHWLNELGIIEKSDLSFLTKKVFPNAATYVKVETAIALTRRIFQLFQSGEIQRDFIEQLGINGFQLLTKNGTLLRARSCFFSNIYAPRLSLESLLNSDMYLDSHYLDEVESITEWKRFFSFLGVKEGITLLSKQGRFTLSQLLRIGFRKEYFEADDKYFRPLNTNFNAHEYSGLVSFFLLEQILTSHIVAKAFWQDAIATIPIHEITSQATAYFGRVGMPGDKNGSLVTNYPEWYVRNVCCLPATDGQYYSSPDLFLNKDEIIKIASKYLPVFDGPHLNADWRAFFGFKTQLALLDYLEVLTKVSQDLSSDNKALIQEIYNVFLDSYANWSETQHEQIREWAQIGVMQEESGAFSTCSNLYYFADGPLSIFQSSHTIIRLNSANKQHPNVLDLLGLFNVNVIRQSDFVLNIEGESSAQNLKTKLNEIIPYLAKWTADMVMGGYDQRIYELEVKAAELQLYQATVLSISLGENLTQKINVNYSSKTLYVLHPWTAVKVMHELPTKLAEHFKEKALTKKLDLLLRSTQEEIREYFIDQNIDLPPENQTSTLSLALSSIAVVPHHVFEPKDLAYYQTFWKTSLQRNLDLIGRFGGDATSLLVNGLKEQRQGQPVNIYHFSHLENAVNILLEKRIRGRNGTKFKDSAGSGIIAQTNEEKKHFARFYFRAKTPTQYYIENMGRGAESVERIGSDPICPVPVFFILPIEQVLAKGDWSVSLASLASQHAVYGNDLDTISRFDFEGVYKEKQEVSHDRFMIAAHQEFLVNNELDLSDIDFRIGVQDEVAKASLVSMLSNDYGLEAMIDVLPELYHGLNPKAVIRTMDDGISASMNQKHGGRFILQHHAGNEDVQLEGGILRHLQSSTVCTSFFEDSLSISTDMTATVFNLYYHYKGHLWLVDTNTHNNAYETGYIKSRLQQWFSRTSTDIDELLRILKLHPELEYWYSQPLPGPDGLTLEAHTFSVLENYLSHFRGRQQLFESEQEYLLCLALHDIGKPRAHLIGDKNLQHWETLSIIDPIADMLPIAAEKIERIKYVIDGDPFGRYLNPLINSDIGEVYAKLVEMSRLLDISLDVLRNSLIIYYQCDSGGYPSLKKRLYELDKEDFILTEDGTRFVFQNKYEEKFISLLETIQLM